MQQHLDGNSIYAAMGTIFLGLFAHVTKSDVALWITIAAGLTTIAVNIKKLRSKK